MSGSTVSITANQISTSRRRSVEKTPPTPAVKIIGGDTAAAILRDARKAVAKNRKLPKKPRWLTALSILTKNLALLVVLLGFVQMIRSIVFNLGGTETTESFSVISGDLDGKIAEVERFVRTEVKAMQGRLNEVDRKVEDGFSAVRREFDDKMEKNGEESELKLKALDVRSDAFEKFMNEFGSKSLLSKEEFGEYFEKYNEGKENRRVDGAEVNLDEIRDYARDILEMEMERHTADGLGMVDYALASGGGRVVKHSEPYGVGKASGSVMSWLTTRNGVSAEAEKLISPSFGEPGHCFPLKGWIGFVEIRLRPAILPEAVTLEHVAKSVAYDRSSAPKQCRVSGWLRGQDPNHMETGSNKMLLLTEFTYDLEKTNAQTFKVMESMSSNPIDTVRLDFTSNHGSATHTCIYRLRVHGREPSSF